MWVRLSKRICESLDLYSTQNRCKQFYFGNSIPDLL